VNPNPAGNVGNDDADAAGAIDGQQAQQTENATRDAGVADADDDPFAGFSLEDMAALERNAAGPGGGLVLFPTGGLGADTPGDDGRPTPSFSPMAGSGNSFGSFGSILSRGAFGGLNGPIGPNPNRNGVK
jgi:hypothetical protein